MNYFPNGTQFSVSSALGVANAVSAISNASQAEVSSVTPPTDGSVVVLQTGWAGLNDRVFVATGADSDSFKINVDTTDVNMFPAGQSAGSFQTVTSFFQLSQVTNTSKSGGDQNFHQFQYLEDKTSTQRQKPTFKGAKSLEITMDYDPALPWYNAMIEADRKQLPVVLRAALPNGAKLYYLVFPSFDEDPTLGMNENMQVKATFSMISALTRVDA